MNTIRFAKPSDASSILDIYAPYILNTSITFETEVPTLEAFQQRIISYQQTWPWLGVSRMNRIDKFFSILYRS
ncbi:MAG TPA: hypothetical protein VIL78_22855, partial [Hanamia sp.]